MRLDTLKLFKIIPFAAGLLVFILYATRVIHFYSGSTQYLIGVIPDDAFYYIQMAKHRVSDGFWTFDGTRPTTGFHFLFGYLLFAIFSIFTDCDLRGIFIFIGLSASISIGASAFFVCQTASDLFDDKIALAAVLPFLTTISVMQSTAMMESWLVLFFSALTIFVVAKEKQPTTYGSIGLFLVGCLGSLARTDYGMLPGILFITTFILQGMKAGPVLSRSFIVLAGAVIGVSIVFAQNYLISGQIAQSSALTKFYWSSINGHNSSVPVTLIRSIIFPSSGKFDKLEEISLGIALLYALAITLRLQLQSKLKIISATLFLGCLFTVLGYILFYRHNSAALQTWYSSNLIAPIAICMAAISYFALKNRSAAFILSVFGSIFYFHISSMSLFYIPWPHQAGMMQAGAFLKKFDTNHSIAGWNVGIISYFSDKPVVNIDGLVNDDVFPFIKSNTLFDYFKSNDIVYLIDYDAMINNKSLRLRGGYDDTRTIKCITPIYRADAEHQGWGDSKLMLFKVSLECL